MQGGIASSRKQDMSELGRKGAAARWGKHYNEYDDEGNANRMDEEDGGTAKMRTRSAARRRGPDGRWTKNMNTADGEDNDNEGYWEGGDENAPYGYSSTGRLSLSEAGRRGGLASSHKQNMSELGKKGAAARWGYGRGRRHSDHANAESSTNEEDEDNAEDYGGGSGGYSGGGRSGRHNMSRSEAGRRGAAARWGKSGGGYREGDGDDWDYGENHSQSGDGQRAGGLASSRKQNMSALGKRGAAARWGRSYGGGYAHPEDEGDGEERRMSRAQNRRRGAAARWGKHYGGGEEGGEHENEGDWERGDEYAPYGYSHTGRLSRSEAGRRGGLASSHKQNMSELGKKGAATRWGYRRGRGHHDNANVESSTDEDVEYNEDNEGPPSKRQRRRNYEY